VTEEDRHGGRTLGSVTTETSEVPRLVGCVVLIPVKAFGAGKARLAPTLDAKGRAELSRMMATRVLGAAAPLPVAVVCDDTEVASWAVENGAMVLPEPGRGLNGAVEAGVARLAALGASEVLVAHADLPMAHGLAQLAGFDGVTLVPDRRDDGTNVVCVPAHTSFRFACGPGSFTRHRAEAELLGLECRVVRQPDLAWDVDVPADIPAEFVPPALL
jgi:2-phospho-L-lactate/phosphoenolpyruvate guanylyltransferase